MTKSNHVPSRALSPLRILNQSGQGLTEYIILLLLVSVISITAVKTFGGTVKKKLDEAEKRVNSEVMDR